MHLVSRHSRIATAPADETQQQSAVQCHNRATKNQVFIVSASFGVAAARAGSATQRDAAPHVAPHSDERVTNQNFLPHEEQNLAAGARADPHCPQNFAPALLEPETGEAGVGAAGFGDAAETAADGEREAAADAVAGV
jgi:hypothetical protein